MLSVTSTFLGEDRDVFVSRMEEIWKGDGGCRWVAGWVWRDGVWWVFACLGVWLGESEIEKLNVYRTDGSSVPPSHPLHPLADFVSHFDLVSWGIQVLVANFNN